MRRVPNPWVLVPVIVATAGAAIVGFQVTRVSCAPGTCTVPAIAIAVLAALVAAVGVGTLMVLTVRSFAEWRELQERAEPERSPRDHGPPTC